ncbi:hypothetical protein N5923_01480 [Erwiniaceae bacterium BAC15a-03b]|uniref:Uncharacterized protein n=1 Tax=Winslowiella arboricola TaxID=2978220 RepID=A0A9J6PK62_9GAMM|nr:hypothetical protein [Winslowiella arboricola]MCU5771200.1 hypothetical protein [Winslowiella arboricola]MCU5776165.1 hypothetical protein [Winslowiella arboricola]
MRAVQLLLLSGIMLLASPVFASSSEAWAAADKAMVQACVKASGLKNARPAGKIMLFDDRVGYSALLLQGRYPQKHMNNQRGRELCLYQRSTKTASVTEADSLMAKAP